MGQRITFNATENNQGGSGWTPLPEGPVVVMFDTLEHTRSSNGNPQVKFTGHVVDGPFAGQKMYYWMTITEGTGWVIEMLVRATLEDGEYEKIETGQFKERKVDGEMISEPIFNYSFDPEDMLGREIEFDCTQRPNPNDPKKINNQFENPRRPGEGQDEAPAAAPAPAPKAQAKPAAQPQTRPAAQAQTRPAVQQQATGAAPARRRQAQ